MSHGRWNGWWMSIGWTTRYIDDYFYELRAKIESERSVWIS